VALQILAKDYGALTLINVPRGAADIGQGYRLQLPKKLFHGDSADFDVAKTLSMGVLGSWLQASEDEVADKCKNAIAQLSLAGIQVVLLRCAIDKSLSWAVSAEYC
jgi:Asp-tRNA(Asn)/Glu-tRNA(Gln) amidotransferase A subunit family amidase